MNARRGTVVSRTRIAATCLLLLGTLCACAGPARQPLGGLNELQRDETIVVGRVELVPALGKGEQKLEGIGSGAARNKLILMADEQYRVLGDEPSAADFGGRIEATLGETFFVRSSNKPFSILGGMLYLQFSAREMKKLYFPGGLKVSVKPGDEAKCIGMLQYHRDEFFEVTKMVVVDDYERANGEFKKAFGSKYALRKALLVPVK
jgi:hypothetical protein